MDRTAKTTRAEAKALAATVPNNKLWARLFTTNPGETGNGAECSVAGYAPVEVTFNAPQKTADGEGSFVSPTADVIFPEFQTTGADITHVAFSETATGNDINYYVELSSPETVKAGKELKIRKEVLKIIEY